MDRLLVLLEPPRLDERLTRALLERLLPVRVEVVDVDRELAAHVVEETRAICSRRSGLCVGERRVAAPSSAAQTSSRAS